MLLTVENIMRLNSLIFGLSGIFSNVICLALSLMIKNNEMKRFRHFLMVYFCCEICYSISHIISQPGFALFSDVYLYFSYQKWTNYVFGKIFLCILTFFFIESITLLMILFIYRYLSLQSMFCIHTSYYEKMMKMLLALAVIILPAAYSCPLTEMWYNPGISQEELDKAFGVVYESYDYRETAVCGFKNENSVLEDKYSVKTAFLISFSVISSECFVIVYCGFKTSIAINIPSMSQRTKKVQKQLLYYLVIQTAITLSCCGAPVILFVVATCFNIPLGSYGTLSTGMLVWFPVLDAVILVSSVAAYRDRLCRIVSKNRDNKVSTVHSIPL